MKKLIVLDVIGLTRSDFQKNNLKNLLQIFENGILSSMLPSFPAVTCSIQASLTTGFYPSEHGIVSNGLYDRETKIVSFWEQSDALVKKPRIWSTIKKLNSNFKTAVLFWQNSLYTNSDIVITPKPIHLENKIVMWCYSKPVNLYEELVEEFGEFDLKQYWGPFVSIKSSEWIIKSAEHTLEKYKPDLIFVYIPHLDYAAQKFGPDSNEFKHSLKELDDLIGKFLVFLSSNFQKNEYEIILHSEYGFNNVNQSISPNTILRDKGLLSTRKISGSEYIDFEHSKAFAMVDHQIAHIFTKLGYENDVKQCFHHNDGIDEILDKQAQEKMQINHHNSGELILCAKQNSWFNYYWWKEEKFAPPFSFNVDIHRKPGYDPLELFIDPKTKRISHDTSLIKGSHGIFDKDNLDKLPIFGTSFEPNLKNNPINIIQVAPTIQGFFEHNS